MWELITVKNAFVSNFSAFEQFLLLLQRVDDVENGYVFWRPPQSKTSVDTLGRRDEPFFLQTGKQLRDVSRRDALELREFTGAWLALIERFDQMQQAVQTVFNTRSEMAQNNLRDGAYSVPMVGLERLWLTTICLSELNRLTVS